MRLAYADPPYPGQAKRHYGKNGDPYDGEVAEVDHEALIRDLRAYDGWALSTSAAALAEVLRFCPMGVRIASWQVTNSAPPGNRGTWWWGWEPVIVSQARPPVITTKDTLSCSTLAGFMGGRLPGEKPPAFCRWVFALIGAHRDDDLDDLFPGSGAVTEEWQRWSRQASLLDGPKVP